METRATLEGPYPLTAQRIIDVIGIGNKNDAGVKVNAHTAPGLSSAYRAIEVNAQTWASIPRTIVDKLTGLPVDKSVGARLLHKPHPEYKTYNWWELAAWHRYIHGNFVGIKYRQGGVGPVVRIMPTDPTTWRQVPVYSSKSKGMDLVDVMWETSNAKGETVQVPSDDIFHIMGHSFDGLWGVSSIRQHAQTYGVQIAAEQYAAKLFGSGSLMSGILRTDKRLTDSQAISLKQRWRSKMAGIDNAHDIAILDNGATFETLTIPPNEAQFLESRAFGIYEIARIFGVPPLLMGVNARDTQGQLTEQVALQFAQFQVKPELDRVASAWQELLPEGEELKHHVQSIVVTDERTKSSAALMWRKARVKSINELRAEQGLTPIDDPEADDPLSDIGAADEGGSDPGDNAGNADPLGDVTTTPTVDTDS